MKQEEGLEGFPLDLGDSKSCSIHPAFLFPGQYYGEDPHTSREACPRLKVLHRLPSMLHLPLDEHLYRDLRKDPRVPHQTSFLDYLSHLGLRGQQSLKSGSLTSLLSESYEGEQNWLLYADKKTCIATLLTFSPLPDTFQAAINLQAFSMSFGLADSYVPSASGKMPTASKTQIGSGGPL